MRRPTTPTRRGQGELWQLFSAYDRRDRKKVIALALKVETLAGKDSVEAQAARGLRDFLEGAYPDAMRELTAAGATSGSRGRLALARAHLFRFQYEKALALLTEQDRESWSGERILRIVEGPFREAYPRAAAALETLSPNGRYRVVTDLGLAKGYVAGLERKLSATADAAQRQHCLDSLTFACPNSDRGSCG